MLMDKSVIAQYMRMESPYIRAALYKWMGFFRGAHHVMVLAKALPGDKGVWVLYNTVKVSRSFNSKV
jgi:hypothetical protein